MTNGRNVKKDHIIVLVLNTIGFTSTLSFPFVALLLLLTQYKYKLPVLFLIWLSLNMPHWWTTMWLTLVCLWIMVGNGEYIRYHTMTNSEYHHTMENNGWQMTKDPKVHHCSVIWSCHNGYSNWFRFNPFCDNIIFSILLLANSMEVQIVTLCLSCQIPEDATLTCEPYGWSVP